MFCFDQVLPFLHGKDNVQVNLGVGVCHFIPFMPLLWSLDCLVVALTINITPLAGLARDGSSLQTPTHLVPETLSMVRTRCIRVPFLMFRNI